MPAETHGGAYDRPGVLAPPPADLPMIPRPEEAFSLVQVRSIPRGAADRSGSSPALAAAPPPPPPTRVAPVLPPPHVRVPSRAAPAAPASTGAARSAVRWTGLGGLFLLASAFGAGVAFQARARSPAPSTASHAVAATRAAAAAAPTIAPPAPPPLAPSPAPAAAGRAPRSNDRGPRRERSGSRAEVEDPTAFVESSQGIGPGDLGSSSVEPTPPAPEVVEAPVAPPPPAAPSATHEDLPPTPSREDVRTALAAVARDVQACANGRVGTVTIEVTFAGSGRVTTALVGRPFGGSPEGSCMARAVRSAQLGEFALPTFNARYSYRVD
ncbi:MAG: hypothetical protein WCJ30_24670 [Deltaproteobacteria bacterium]